MHRLTRTPWLLLVLCTLGLAACDDAPGDDTATDTSGDVATPTTLEACVRDVPTNGRVVEYLTLESADATTRVRIARRVTDGQTVGETFALELAAFGLERDGALVCIGDPARLDYVWGHHNWDETATATAEDGTAYALRLQLQVTEELVWQDTLEARGAAAWGPLELDATDCATDPPGDLNFCLQRPRSDQ